MGARSISSDTPLKLDGDCWTLQASEALALHDADIRQISIELLVIEAETNNEAIGNFETPEFDGNLNNSAGCAVEHGADAQGFGAAAGESLKQVPRRESRID